MLKVIRRHWLVLSTTGLKDHIVSEKRLSSTGAGGAVVPMGKLSRRRQDEDPVDPTNYLHPKIPSSRMGTSHFEALLTEFSHRITWCHSIMGSVMYWFSKPGYWSGD